LALAWGLPHWLSWFWGLWTSIGRLTATLVHQLADGPSGDFSVFIIMSAIFLKKSHPIYLLSYLYTHIDTHTEWKREGESNAVLTTLLQSSRKQMEIRTEN
jgi:hypothetical protein